MKTRPDSVMRFDTTTVDRFIAKVQFNDAGCWLWQAAVNGKGYGWFGGTKRAPILAHRYMAVLVNGGIPEGMGVLHHCDNPPCVRPDHLFFGSQIDNVRDRDTKGRGRWRGSPGEANGAAVLKEADVREIRRLCNEHKLTQREIGVRFGVPQSAVSKIALRIRWKHL